MLSLEEAELEKRIQPEFGGRSSLFSLNRLTKLQMCLFPQASAA